MDSRINKLMGSNMDIDFSNADFGNTACPQNVADNTSEHKCAVKNTSIARIFAEYNTWTAFCAVILMIIYPYWIKAKWTEI